MWGLSRRGKGSQGRGLGRKNRSWGMSGKGKASRGGAWGSGIGGGVCMRGDKAFRQWPEAQKEEAVSA